MLEHQFCSARGVCDFSTGICTCFTDYQGDDCNVLANIPDDIDDHDGFLVNPTGLSYTGKALHLKTTKASATDFKFIYAEANDVNVFEIDGSGNTNWHDGDVDISLNSNHIRFHCDEFIYTAKAVDGIYPDYQRIMPAPGEGDKIMEVERENAAFEKEKLQLSYELLYSKLEPHFLFNNR